MNYIKTEINQAISLLEKKIQDADNRMLHLPEEMKKEYGPQIKQAYETRVQEIYNTYFKCGQNM